MVEAGLMAKRGFGLKAKNFVKTKGLNTNDSDADMDPSYARTLLNYSVNSDSKPTLRGAIRPLNSAIIPGSPRIIEEMEWISNTASTAKQIIVQTNDGRLFRKNADHSMTQLSVPVSLTSGSRFRWVMFNGNLIMANGTEA